MYCQTQANTEQIRISWIPVPFRTVVFMPYLDNKSIIYFFVLPLRPLQKRNAGPFFTISLLS